MPLTRRAFPSGVVCYTSPLLDRAGVRHGFGTRVGGVSRPPFDTLSLGGPAGSATPDAAENVAENFRRLAAAVGCERHRRREVRQVHGAGVVVVGGGAADGKTDGKTDGRTDGWTDGATEGDALVTAAPGELLVVRVADCCPVLAATADGRAVAAAHAGWRGVVAGVVPAAVRALCDVAGSGAGELVAAVGPCVGPAAFEVGPEVVAAFDAALGEGSGVVTRRAAEGKGHVDLAEACRRQLAAAGVTAVDVAGLCTVENAGEFFSHRRDRGLTGRMAAVIAASVGNRQAT